MRSVTVVRTGPQALVQDAGRPGLAHLGVPPSGAVDLPALERANRLVGNPATAAGIEAVLGGVALRASCACVVAVTGAPARLRLVPAAGSPGGPGSTDRAGSTGGRGSSVSRGGTRADDDGVEFGTAVRLEPGDVLRVGTPGSGLRCYLAVSGGIAVPAELGSRSTDVLSGIGPAPLSPGDTLPLGDAPPPGDIADDGSSDRAAAGPRIELPVLLGPRDDWFDGAAEQLAAAEWTVSPTGNRIGVRLDGTQLRRASRFDGVELPTEPVVTGAVQVPPAGQPVVFLNDHPTTGGYPVIAVVHPAALPTLAQARPGAAVRLRP